MLRQSPHDLAAFDDVVGGVPGTVTAIAGVNGPGTLRFVKMMFVSACRGRVPAIAAVKTAYAPIVLGSIRLMLLAVSQASRHNDFGNALIPLH